MTQVEAFSITTELSSFMVACLKNVLQRILVVAGHIRAKMVIVIRTMLVHGDTIGLKTVASLKILPKKVMAYGLHSLTA
jgi:hypothetical protein